MGLLDWLLGTSEAAPEPATDYQLQDGSGVYVDPECGPLAGYIMPDPSCEGGAFVAPYGQHVRMGDYDHFITQPAPDDWQDRVVRAWNS